MKKLLIFSLLSFSFTNLFSQQLSESFLNSLPDNIKDDFANESVKEDSADKRIENPDSRIKALETSLNEARALLDKIQYEVSSNESTDMQKLERIGQKFFQSYQSTFLPINQPNIDPSYILDVGDQLTVQLIGQKNKTHNLLIKRDGSINLPDLGIVNLAGLSLDNASRIIKDKYKTSFIGIDVFVSLTEIRDINVLIVGNSNNPGMYTLRGGSSPLDLLHASGGLDQNGSYRTISHKRNNQVLQNIDVYDVLINGNLSFKHSLRSGDVLVVHPKHREIYVSGSFFNPGIYEITDQETLDDLLKIAGVRNSHSQDFFRISRLQNGSLETLEIDKSNVANLQLVDGDALTLSGASPRFNPSKKVKITGEVSIPGEYSLDHDATLLDLITMAGFYTKNAYIEGGILLRQSIREIELTSKDKSYNELVRYLIASPDFSKMISGNGSDGILTFLSILKEYEPSGRMIIEFDPNKIREDTRLNRLLEDGDVIHIPSFSQEVFIFGEVMSPGAYSYNELKTAKEYIENAGGYSRVADSNKVILIAPNGEAKLISRGSIPFFANQEFILPGSTIYVPREVGKLDGINLASAVAPIVSSLALSLASLNAINN